MVKKCGLGLSRKKTFTRNDVLLARHGNPLIVAAADGNRQHLNRIDLRQLRKETKSNPRESRACSNRS